MPNQNTRTYVCNSRVKLDGDMYEGGDDIELTQSQAAQMLENPTPSISEKPSQQSNVVPLNSDANANDESGADDNANTDNEKPKLSKEEQKQKIVDVIKTLDPEDQAHFTASNKPDAKMLSEKVGFNVSAKWRDAIWAELQG